MPTRNRRTHTALDSHPPLDRKRRRKPRLTGAMRKGAIQARVRGRRRRA